MSVYVCMVLIDGNVFVEQWEVNMTMSLLHNMIGCFTKLLLFPAAMCVCRLHISINCHTKHPNRQDVYGGKDTLAGFGYVE
jgi:hypothetical protein